MKSLATTLGLDDPSSPAGFTIHRLEVENNSLRTELTQAREQVIHYVENNARLKAEKTALEEDKTQLQRHVLELEAREQLRGRR